MWSVASAQWPQKIMNPESIADSEIQTVLEAVADPECRDILDELDTARSTSEIAERCDLSETSAYRKLEMLSETQLVKQGTELRTDGHHVKTYERDVTSALVLWEADSGLDAHVLREPLSVSQRLAQFWSRISEEL
ncbi:Helix-turn-helix domain-containing protein [Halorientalis persicus]|uniref:Helix-turn-helix domain-containing protein n=2 Tax=Halorientalis persicus TaxID=1367881 RepID=A0A1H8WWW5_9EURY|nr:Helix-turn-helix domain-containing protein [Halorientalis persicus]